MHANFPCLRVLFVNAMYISVLGGDLFACSGELLIKMYCVFKMEKNKHDLCLWAKGVRMSGWAILGLKSCVSQKLIPQARIMDKWVPADGGGGMHFRI